jgi:hypothetical protein
VTINAELEGKGPDGKDRASAKKSKGTSVSLGKAGESAKAASGSGNDGASQRYKNLGVVLDLLLTYFCISFSLALGLKQDFFVFYSLLHSDQKFASPLFSLPLWFKVMKVALRVHQMQAMRIMTNRYIISISIALLSRLTLLAGLCMSMS